MVTAETRTAEWALRPLVEAAAGARAIRGGLLPESLHHRYGGDLSIGRGSRRPTVVANFVSTLDGVVSYNTSDAAGGGEISGFFEPDRFVMGLLRALADVVLIGAGTLRAAPSGRWTPGSIHPPSASAYAALRHELGLTPEPLTAVITASGQIDLSHPGLSDPRVPVLIVTTDVGQRALAGRARPDHVRLEAAGSARVDLTELPELLRRRGADLVLCEGGPLVMGQLLREGLVDELFLTLAPQIAGRSADSPRLALVEGTAFRYSDAPWARLMDLRRCGDHLFARYRMEGRN